VDSLNTGQNSLPFPWYVELAAAMKKGLKHKNTYGREESLTIAQKVALPKGFDVGETWKIRLLLYLHAHPIEVTHSWTVYLRPITPLLPDSRAKGGSNVCPFQEMPIIVQGSSYSKRSVLQNDV